VYRNNQGRRVSVQKNKGGSGKKVRGQKRQTLGEKRENNQPGGGKTGRNNCRSKGKNGVPAGL